MSVSRLEYLFNGYVQNTCTEKEEEELMILLSSPENEVEVKKLIDQLIDSNGLDVQMPGEAAASVLQSILQKDKTPVVPLSTHSPVFPLWKRVAAAVVILFISGTAFWIVTKENKEKVNSPVAISNPKPSPVLPGGNHAILTMADGRKIILDSVQNGNIKGGIAKISKQGALLVYDGSAYKANSPAVYNTLSTPRGGQFQLILPDGSKVWLNASSSIRFPTAFTGSQRVVELTGEAYFEIAKNKKMPFRVNVKGMQVEVLGTHFNVNAYSEEGDIKTTLLEGSVRLQSGQRSGLLNPGEQGIVKRDEDKLMIKKADIEQVIAWKNGVFQFNGADIITIMNEISRWYDVDVVYSGRVPARMFEGKISRSAELAQVLKILELSNVKFRVEGKKIIVE